MRWVEPGGGSASARVTGQRPSGALRCAQVFYRSDRLMRPRTRLPIAALIRHDGWCDDPADRNYNRRVQHPYPASAEHLWRADRLYDVVVVIGYNDDPARCGRGSAIFMHVAGPGLSRRRAASRLRVRICCACCERVRRRRRRPAWRLTQRRAKKAARKPKHRAEFGARLGEGARSGDVCGPRSAMTRPRPAYLLDVSPCSATSRPSTSATSLTRRPIDESQDHAGSRR